MEIYTDLLLNLTQKHTDEVHREGRHQLYGLVTSHNTIAYIKWSRLAKSYVFKWLVPKPNTIDYLKFKCSQNLSPHSSLNFSLVPALFRPMVVLHQEQRERATKKFLTLPMLPLR